MKRWLAALVVLLLGRGRRRARLRGRDRVVPPGFPDRRAENAVLLLFGCAALCAVAFPVVYAVDSIPNQTQFLGLSLGLAFAFVAAACVLIGKRLVVTEENEEEYGLTHPEEQETLGQLVDESGDRITRKRLLLLAGGAAGTALGVALVTPAASLGPFFDVNSFYRTPWRRGIRLVDEVGGIFHVDDVEEETFYTAYPERADREQMGAPLVVVRLKPAQLQLPADRHGWAPDGIVAYSKICTHAGCAIALYRKPKFPPVEPKPALVCPCHYSTFDPARAGKVLFGPAGRPLPQLPLQIGPSGELQAAGNFSGPVGPSWWGVRNHGARS
ncbi:MAG: Rieske 2Fe-2S domain-containing protein [Actinobacteria bacterium]|nr:MAG: Rieske 2Fe-2S domain-containing protein [Actinomycetota bacterium]